MGWNSDHMCDDGVQEVVDGLTKAFMDFVVDKVQGFSFFDIVGFGTIIHGDGEIPERHRNFRDAVQDAIMGLGVDTGQSMCETLEPAFERVVSAIDEQMEEVRVQAGRDLTDSGDYVYIDDVPADQSEEVDELGYKVDELETEIEELKENGTRTVHLHGHVEPFSWNEGRQLFVCPKTGQAYKLVESDEICTCC